MLGEEEAQLLGDATGAIVAVGDDGRIAFATDEACRMFGWDQSLVGQPLTTVIPPRLQPRHEKGFSRYVGTGESRLQGGTVRVPALRRDGTEQEVDLTIRVFRRPDGTKLVSAGLSLASLGRPPPGLRVLESALAKRLYELV